MAMPRPQMPPYDIDEWQKRPFPERLRMVCQAWALQGYGTPAAIYVVYLLKIGLYIGGWLGVCALTPALGGPGTIAAWWSAPLAIQKAVLWSMLFEGLGLGCGSGPLTGRYFPPVGGILYFARPGTTKMPLFPGLPLFGGDRRTWLDVVLYLAHVGFLVRALVSATLPVEVLLPTVVLLPILGVTDKTLFLSARAEHFYTALICFLFPNDWLAGTRLVWVAVWLWAATSKLNAHFPSVVAVMQSNSPLTGFGSMRKALFRGYPDDLRPSRLAVFLAHAGTLVEYVFPLVLLASPGGLPTKVALITMLGFHVFITSSIPMGVPLEWNVIMVYGAFALFGGGAGFDSVRVSSPVVIAALMIACFLLPLLGNLFPSRFSFLTSMRYYAGNWAYSVWLFRGRASSKLDACLVKSAPRVQDQLARFYDARTTTGLLSKVIAFRAMHLHGRALQLLLPKAVDDIDEYEWLDGELVAGVVIGWNFGEGHLHNAQLLRALQRQCQFAEGDVRCIFVESQPMGRPTMSWTIADAATGVRETGTVKVTDLEALQPWPVNEDGSDQA
ncbi:MAG: DUF3556 domain-containing protein [Polyangiaceae bacterium]